MSDALLPSLASLLIMTVCDRLNLLSGQPVDSVWHPELVKMREDVGECSREPSCDMEVIETFLTCAGDVSGLLGLGIERALLAVNTHNSGAMSGV